MPILDCESETRALESIGEILNRPQRFLSQFLLSARFPHGVHRRESLWPLIEAECGSSYRQRYTACCWFHGTRVPADCSFNEGLLPLVEIIGNLWSFLYSLVSATVAFEDWCRFRKSVESHHESHSALLYRLKMANPQHHGPHAFLVKDVFFSPRELGHQDYFTIPEIVEDICTCYEESFGYPALRGLFIQATRPCVVKFSSNPCESSLSNALLYARSILRGEGVSGFPILSLPEKRAVAPERILSVKYVTNWA